MLSLTEKYHAKKAYAKRIHLEDMATVHEYSELGLSLFFRLDPCA